MISVCVFQLLQLMLMMSRISLPSLPSSRYWEGARCPGEGAKCHKSQPTPRRSHWVERWTGPTLLLSVCRWYPSRVTGWRSTLLPNCNVFIPYKLNEWAVGQYLFSLFDSPPLHASWTKNVERIKKGYLFLPEDIDSSTKFRFQDKTTEFSPKVSMKFRSSDVDVPGKVEVTQISWCKDANTFRFSPV